VKWASQAWVREEPPYEARALWSALCAGVLRVTEIVELPGRTVGIFEELEGQGFRSAITSRRIAVLQRRLSGESEKSIACQLGLSGSTICGEIQRALGLVSRDRRIPGLMMLLARLYHNDCAQSRLDARLTRIAHGNARYVVLTLPALELDPAGRLAPAEREICGQFLRGDTHRQIARVRGTRPRTVSNQIASIFQKLNVSGRMTLMVTLIRRETEAAATHRALTG
jgi:DNA-binding NarL/FixJ family response regulator